MASRATYPDLKGKTFVVTGAASGMGRTLSLQLAAQGAKLGLLDLRAPDATAAEISQLGAESLALACNVQDASAVDAAFKAVVDRFGRLDGAANMAGIVGNQKLGETKYAIDALVDSDWDNMLATNLNGVKNCLRAEFRLMSGNAGGSIINAASISGQLGHPFASPYNVSKWGVIGLTKCAAQEVGGKRIRVNAVAPLVTLFLPLPFLIFNEGTPETDRLKLICRFDRGIIDTPLTQSLGSKEVLQQYLGSHIALGRFAGPEEVTKVLVFLLSDEASYITGSVSLSISSLNRSPFLENSNKLTVKQVVNIDGGWS